MYTHLRASQVGKQSTCNAGNKRLVFDHWVWMIPWRKGMATHSSILAERIPMDRGASRATVQGVTRSRTQLPQLNTHINILLTLLRCILKSKKIKPFQVYNSIFLLAVSVITISQFWSVFTCGYSLSI